MRLSDRWPRSSLAHGTTRPLVSVGARCWSRGLPHPARPAVRRRPRFRITPPRSRLHRPKRALSAGVAGKRGHSILLLSVAQPLHLGREACSAVMSIAFRWRRAASPAPATGTRLGALDIGAGLPTADNTHEVAQRTAPECRIVYVVPGCRPRSRAPMGECLVRSRRTEKVKARRLPTPCHSQLVAHGGPCRKARVVAQNRRPRPEVGEIRDSRSTSAFVDCGFCGMGDRRWDSRCGCGHAARRSGCARRRNE